MAARQLRSILTELGLLPAVFVESSDIRIANFRFQRYKTQVLKPGGPGYRKWINVDALKWNEVEYHLNRFLKENQLNVPENYAGQLDSPEYESDPG